MRLLADGQTLGWGETLLRVAVAGGLGAAIGLERELDEKAAGLRTHIVVSLGSALFTLIGAYGFSEFPRTSVDPSRIAAQIVTGIGFLGAGAILRDGGDIRGLTTAASVWTVAAIGMACGAGLYVVAVGGTVLAIFALEAMDRIEHRIRR
ncbi:MAG TPA: MgtC/SapB family protein [Candidatus Limnocylindria bacterium]|nr:MgtC/SapB family protein [Candidatus Limnocylindria bacterium]